MESFNNSMAMPVSYPFIGHGVAGHSGGGGAASRAVVSPWMDSRIWSRLPQRLVDHVIAFLSPPAFFRARAVCKRWYALLFSNSFLELYLQISPKRHWFLFFKQKSPKTHIFKNTPSTSTSSTSTQIPSPSICEAFLFDPYEFTWYHFLLPLIPPGFSPASSSGGLVAFFSGEAGPKTLVLCNPITGSHTPLPPTLRPRLFPSIGINVTNTSIDVVVGGDDLISQYAVKNISGERFFVDGAGGFYSIWGSSSSLPRLCSLESGEMVYVGRRFYSMNFSPFSILAFDVAANHWCKIQAPMRRFLRSPCLVESRGKLILVAAVEKSKLNVPKSLRLWGLQSCGTTWVEIERMPQQLYAQFEDIENGRGFTCVGHGEFIIIVIRGSEKSLLFDFNKKRWLWLPHCPFIGDGGDLHGFAYEPRLATPVTVLLDQLVLPFQSFNG